MILRDFDEICGYRLLDKRFMQLYLDACLEEGMPTFIRGIRTAVQAREGGFTWLARETGMGRESLYKAFGPNGNPSFKTVYRVLNALGVRMTCGAPPKKNRRRANIKT